jgi:hypothetical protein
MKFTKLFINQWLYEWGCLFKTGFFERFLFFFQLFLQFLHTFVKIDNI